MPFLIGGKLKIMSNFALQAEVACAKFVQTATIGQAMIAFQLPLLLTVILVMINAQVAAAIDVVIHNAQK